MFGKVDDAGMVTSILYLVGHAYNNTHILLLDWSLLIGMASSREVEEVEEGSGVQLMLW
jgi:hypothetical protein